MTEQPISGIALTATAEVTDWEAFGDHVARASSPDQAAFLAGFCCGLAALQPTYIADEVAGSNARDTIIETLDTLASLIRSTELAPVEDGALVWSLDGRACPECREPNVHHAGCSRREARA